MLPVVMELREKPASFICYCTTTPLTGIRNPVLGLAAMPPVK